VSNKIDQKTICFILRVLKSDFLLSLFWLRSSQGLARDDDDDDDDDAVLKSFDSVNTVQCFTFTVSDLGSLFLVLFYAKQISDDKR